MTRYYVQLISLLLLFSVLGFVDVVVADEEDCQNAGYPVHMGTYNDYSSGKLCITFSNFKHSFLAEQNKAQCQRGDRDRVNCNKIADNNENTRSVRDARDQDDVEDNKIRGDKLMVISV